MTLFTRPEFLISALLILCIQPAALGQCELGPAALDVTANPRFIGTCAGGQIEWANAAGCDPQTGIIETAPGESVESVASKMREQILGDAWSVFASAPRAEHRSAMESDALTFPLILGGTETGLGRTPCPKGLSGFFDQSTSRFVLAWEAAEGTAYDRMLVTRSGPVASQIDPRCTSLAYPRREWDQTFDEFTYGQQSFQVWGISNGLPSAAGGILVDGNTFREALDIPTDSGLQPNWSFLPLPGRDTVTARRVKNAQKPRHGERDDREWPHRPELKPAHQELRQPEGFGVIYRPVCGVRPGEKFDVSIRARFVDAPAEGRLVIWLSPERPTAGPFEGQVLEACEARLRSDGFRQIGALGTGQLPLGWVESSSTEAFPEGFALPDGKDRFFIVVAVENLGHGAVHMDWLTVTRRVP